MNATARPRDDAAAPARVGPLLWLLVALWLAVAIWFQWESIAESYDHLALLDLQVYRMGGRALIDQAPLYEVTYPRDALPFTYTPFAAMLFVPLAWLSPGASALVMTSISIACALRVIVLIDRSLPARSARVPRRVVAFCVACSLWATRSTLEFGQVNLIIIWLVFEDLFGAGRRSRWAGVLLGLAIGIKLTPAFFLLFLLCLKDVRRVVVAATVAVGTVAVGFAVQPAQAWVYWSRAAYDASRTGSPAYVNNQSWNGVITRLSGSTGHLVLWLVLTVVTTMIVLWIATTLWRDDQQVLATCAVAIGALLASPISWSHHWVWFLPMVVALLNPHRPEPSSLRWGRRAVLAVVVVVAFPRVLFLVPWGGDVEYQHNPLERLVGNSYVVVALVFLAYSYVVARGSCGAHEVNRVRST